MIVILTKDVKGTGKAGDVVKVNDGYARNMLIPKGLAREATQGNVRSLEKQKAIAEEKREEEKIYEPTSRNRAAGLHAPPLQPCLGRYRRGFRRSAPAGDEGGHQRRICQTGRGV